MARRFELLDTPDGLAIRCRQCGRISYNANDVALRYCDQCKAFLADLPRMTPPPPGPKEAPDG